MINFHHYSSQYKNGEDDFHGNLLFWEFPTQEWDFLSFDRISR